MELAAGFLIGLAIFAVSASRKRARTDVSQGTTKKLNKTKDSMTEQEVDELITVIIPTINNDR